MNDEKIKTQGVTYVFRAVRASGKTRDHECSQLIAPQSDGKKTEKNSVR